MVRIDSIAIGNSAGTTNQGDYAVAVGTNCGEVNQSLNATAMGTLSGTLTQGENAVAVGVLCGYDTQGKDSVAVGTFAGATRQGATSVGVGYNAGGQDQDINSVAVGWQAGAQYQQYECVAMGYQAGNNNQNYRSVAIGVNAGKDNQLHGSIAIGPNSGTTNQSVNGTAVGSFAGSLTQGQQAVAMGVLAGYETQGIDSVAIGSFAGGTRQGTKSVAMGYNAGGTDQGIEAVALGWEAGKTTQGADAVAIGKSAGTTTQGQYAISIGNLAGESNQGQYSVAIGYMANNNGPVSTNSIAIGRQAGEFSLHSNTIVLNAQGSTLNSGGSNRCYIAPIRNNTSGTNFLNYDPTTKEISYAATPPASSLLPITLDTVNHRVGINKSVPTQALDVTGNLETSGTITANGRMIAGNGLTISPGVDLIMNVCHIYSDGFGGAPTYMQYPGSLVMDAYGTPGASLWVKESANTLSTGWNSVITTGVTSLPNITSVGTLTGLTIGAGGNLLLNATKVTSGTGTPEAVVTAPVGSLFLRTNGAAGTCLYIKETGAGNTGWIPVITALSGAITLTTAAQPNVTSVGTLTGLTLSGPITPTYSGTSPTSSQIGYTTITSASTTLPGNGSSVNIQSISVASGVWLVEGQTNITANAPGLWHLSLSTTSATIDTSRSSTVVFSSTNQRYGRLICPFFLSATTTIYLIGNATAATNSSSATIRITRIA